MNQNRIARNIRPWVARLRFQLISGWIFAVLLPILILKRGNVYYTIQEHGINSLIGAAVAVTVGLIVMRRLTNYPSIAAGSYVVISFTLSYLTIIGFFFVTRLQYSNALFLMSFVFCLLWFVALYFYIKRLVKIRYAIIPGGNTKRLHEIGHVEWSVLETPEGYISNQGPVVADLRHSHAPEWERFIAECALRGIPVYHSKQITEFLTGKVEIEHLSENTFGSLLPSLIYQRLKRAGDTVLSILFLPVVLMVLAVAAALILVFSGRPILFKQKRMGYRGIPFTVYKLRTMENNENDVAGRSSDEMQNLQKESFLKEAMTSSDDKRITRLGKFLRKYRIDELPQVFNIIRGEMSWIGPRPEAIVLSKWYENELPFYRYRHIVRLGITGWVQVNQGHVAELEQVNEKLHYDFFYIKNLSAWLDFLIVLKTVWIVVTGFGSK